jgi:hypothetical protein
MSKLKMTVAILEDGEVGSVEEQQFVADTTRALEMEVVARSL